MPRKNSTCAPSSCAVRMPIHGMCVRQVVPALLALDVTRLRLLVLQEQAFVRGEEIDRGDFVRRAAAAHALEEVERVGDGVDDLLVLLASAGECFMKPRSQYSG